MKAPVAKDQRIFASITGTVSLWISAVVAQAAVLGTLPSGQRYVRNEIHFALKAAFAVQLSSAGNQRRMVERTRIQGLHRDIAEIKGNHTCARNWLEGKPMPARIKQQTQEVPRIARSLAAILTPGVDAASVLEEFRQLPEVEWASLVVAHRLSEVPNDPDFWRQWGPVRINATNAWDVAPATTALHIAIIDTGVDLDHPDLAARISFEAGYGDFGTGNAPQDGRNRADHGTHVAGIAAAIRNNSEGIAGIADATIMALNCATWDDDERMYMITHSCDAINDAIANHAEIINCSFCDDELGDLGDCMKSALDNALEQDVLVVVSAGNEANDVTGHYWDQHFWPFIVSATDEWDALSNVSNFGAGIDIAAPGVNIWSTIVEDAYYHQDAKYGLKSGTSMAAPHVSGAAAMVKSMNPNRISSGATRDLLGRMAVDLGDPGEDVIFGIGRLSLSKTFLETLKAAEAFVGPSMLPWHQTGSYSFPYTTLSDAVEQVGPGTRLVLNGGLIRPDSYTYPPITINKALTLMALPDRSVVIGK